MQIPLISPYMHWLHTRWPAGTVEKLPVVNEDGSTNVPGLYVVGDLTGVPLLKFSADTGAKVVQKIAFRQSTTGGATAATPQDLSVRPASLGVHTEFNSDSSTFQTVETGSLLGSSATMIYGRDEGLLDTVIFFTVAFSAALTVLEHANDVSWATAPPDSTISPCFITQTRSAIFRTMPRS